MTPVRPNASCCNHLRSEPLEDSHLSFSLELRLSNKKKQSFKRRRRIKKKTGGLTPFPSSLWGLWDSGSLLQNPALRLRQLCTHRIESGVNGLQRTIRLLTGHNYAETAVFWWGTQAQDKGMAEGSQEDGGLRCEVSCKEHYLTCFLSGFRSENTSLEDWKY